MVEFIIKIVIPLLCAILTVYVIPLLKQKKLYDAVVIAVNAAEQIYTQSGMGKEKYEYVKELPKTKVGKVAFKELSKRNEVKENE